MPFPHKQETVPQQVELIDFSQISSDETNAHIKAQNKKKHDLEKKQNDEKITEEKTKKQRMLEMAQFLDRFVLLKAAYGLLDSLSISYSTLNYVCSIATKTSDAKDLLINDTLTSADGLIVFGACSAILIGISVLANTASKDVEGFQKDLAKFWPYLRDSLKGAKNAYKGISNVLKVAGALNHGANYRYLATPIGLLLGGINVVNRIYYRRICDKRKEAMAENAKLRQALSDVKIDNYSDFENKVREYHVNRHTTAEKRKALLSAALGGTIDGLYYQMGMLTITTIAPPLLIALTVICGGLFIANIVSRTFQEYIYQRNLEKTAIAYEVTLKAKFLTYKINELTKIPKNSPQYKEALEELQQECEEYERLKKKHEKLNAPSMKIAFFQGLSDGMSVYGAVASIFFSVSLVLMLCSVTMPPLAVAATIISGLVLLAGFTLYTTIKAYKKQKKEQKQQQVEDIFTQKPEINKKLYNDLINDLKEMDKEAKSKLEHQKIEKKILGHLTTDESPQPSFQELSEVIRSLFSGLGKGEKPYDVYLTAEPDNKVQTALTWATLGTSIVYGLVFALRAFAKNFSRFCPKKSKQEAEKNTKDLEQQAPPKEPAMTIGRQPSLKRSNSHVTSRHSFFSSTEGKSKLKRTQSLPDLKLAC